MDVLASQSRGQTAAVNTGAAPGLAIALGCCLLLVNGANAALQWWDMDIGSVQWELAITTQMFERVPMFMLSLMLVALGALMGGRVWLVRASALAFWLGALTIMALSVLYAIAAAQSYHAIPALVQLQFKASALKNALATSLFIVVCTYAGVVLWRSVRRGRVRSATEPEITSEPHFAGR